MIYTYKFSVIDPEGKVSQETEKVNTTGWLDYLKANPDRYGNLHEFLASSFPALNGEDPLVAASIAMQVDEQLGQHEPTIVIQYALYCWEAFKAGQIPSGAWGAALACGWVCSERALLDGVVLKQDQVLEMFEAADKEALFRIGCGKKGWDTYLAALPDEVSIYRGVSTGSKYLENGLSWTLSAEEAKQFAGKNVRTAKDIPGVIQASVPKSAILAAFGVGKEVVIDPRVTKQNVVNNFLSGPGLSKFRQNWKKWKAAEATRLAEWQKQHR